MALPCRLSCPAAKFEGRIVTRTKRARVEQSVPRAKPEEGGGQNSRHSSTRLSFPAADQTVPVLFFDVVIRTVNKQFFSL
jgi:hypothetical protein